VGHRLAASHHGAQRGSRAAKPPSKAREPLTLASTVVKWPRDEPCDSPAAPLDANHNILGVPIPNPEGAEEQGWSIPQTINSALVKLDNELPEVALPVDLKNALTACRKFWLQTAGAQEVSRGPSLRDRKIRRLLKGKVKMGPSERPFAFILSDNRDSYFCFKSDLPDGIPDGAFLQFDAIPSFDKKKTRESWKAVNIRAD